MKLLIVTQKVDRTDPILGFFHRWLEAFAQHGETITVIGQYVGAYELPHNVSVVSLEKEKGRGTFSQILRFWKFCISHRASYDQVFVHMTPIWIILGAPIWLVLGKKMYLWYEIKRGGFKLKLALLFVKKVFAASKHGLPSVSRKQVTTGHGIDIDLFDRNPEAREAGHLVAVGRVTRIKHCEVLLRALAELPDCRLTIAGGTVTEEDKAYEAELRSLMHRLSIADRVEMGWVSPEEMPTLLHRADVFVHASQGGFDKAVLQAMACGTPVITTSEAAASALPPECCATSETVADQTAKLLALSADQRLRLGGTLRAIVEEDHSVNQCIERLVHEMK